MTDLRAEVNAYFRHRKLVDPDLIEAFAFLLTEVAELAEAIQETHSIDDDQTDLLENARVAGLLAARWVDRRKGWVRNHEHKNDNPADEIGDCQMMLTKVAEKLGVDPVEAMYAKWNRKGFDVLWDLEVQRNVNNLCVYCGAPMTGTVFSDVPVCDKHNGTIS